MNDGKATEFVDTALIHETRTGDPAAFKRLFDKYHRRVYNLIYRMVGNDQDASDLTQEVFVRVYNSLHLLKSEGAFFSWVRTVATNICRDHFRKMGRSIKTDSLDQKIDLEEGEVQREIEDWSANPERELEKKDLQEAVQKAISSLSEEHRTVIVLHHIEGMDISEISLTLHVPVGTVKSRLARARDELKRKLGHFVA
ncbi:MAG TPA: sigma-70 family RNA polymerase sigma factor [Armatimonadota bacterium]